MKTKFTLTRFWKILFPLLILAALFLIRSDFDHPPYPPDFVTIEITKPEQVLITGSWAIYQSPWNILQDIFAENFVVDYVDGSNIQIYANKAIDSFAWQITAPKYINKQLLYSSEIVITDLNENNQGLSNSDGRLHQTISYDKRSIDTYELKVYQKFLSLFAKEKFDLKLTVNWLEPEEFEEFRNELMSEYLEKSPSKFIKAKVQYNDIQGYLENIEIENSTFFYLNSATLNCRYTLENKQFNKTVKLQTNLEPNSTNYYEHGVFEDLNLLKELTFFSCDEVLEFEI